MNNKKIEKIGQVISFALLHGYITLEDMMPVLKKISVEMLGEPEDKIFKKDVK